MESTMKDAMSVETTVETKEVVRKKSRSKPKTFKEGAVAAGLQALEALESSDDAARPVMITAKNLVEEGIEVIMRLRNKGVPLLRIYNDMRKATGMRIGYPTFAGYTCEIAKERGLKLEKTKKEAVAAPRHQPDPKPAGVAGEASMADGWVCGDCVEKSVRLESQAQPGAFYWRCPECRTLYADNAGEIATKRLQTAKKGE